MRPLSENQLSTIPEALPGAPPFTPELRERLANSLASRAADDPPRTRNRRKDDSPLYSNRLLLEANPYLRQHAHNPVNWYPWGEEAFEEARRLDRPVLVSIGYSTCHWCHVMEEESFEDPEIARLLNQHFIAIKVDREVRPDVDAVYMSAVQAMTGSGGWPLNVWLTPERKPFYGGTYFPPRDYGPRRGFAAVLEAIQRHYSQNRGQVAEAAERLTEFIRRDLEAVAATATEVPGEEALKLAQATYARTADRERGGLHGPMKFPSSLPIRFLLRLHRRTGDRDALQLATLTLERMAAGGIHDQVGGGFHRYATDPDWLVPHFEKMLYDNALLALAYLEGWQVTGRLDFACVTEEILGYIRREMTSPDGGFYSATDADSLDPDGKSVEGWFFTWTPEEIEAVVGAQQAPYVNAYYGVTSAGDLEGRSVLRRERDPAELADSLGVEREELLSIIRGARERLYQARARRPAPLRDEKMLAAWNGLMISAFAQAGFALDEPAHIEAARRAARFVLGEMRENGRLLRTFQGGSAGGPAFLEDYAFLIAGLLDLYEADPDVGWLREALSLQETLDTHYADETGGAYFNNADDQERLLAREKPSQDGAVPSGNSIAARNLLRLAQLTGDDLHRERAASLFSAFHELLTRAPTAVSEMLLALDFQLEPTKEIAVIRPPSGGDLAGMLAPLRAAHLPNRVLAIATEGDDLRAHSAAVPLLAGKLTREGKVTAYVCENRVCDRPTTDPEVFASQLRQ
jgi:uncharacterized protein YyaL (SSP411 family)